MDELQQPSTEMDDSESMESDDNESTDNSERGRMSRDPSSTAQESSEAVSKDGATRDTSLDFHRAPIQWKCLDPSTCSSSQCACLVPPTEEQESLFEVRKPRRKFRALSLFVGPLAQRRLLMY